jgi:hypothetical protein
MIWALWAVFGSTSQENSSVNRLNTTKSDWNVELSQKLFSSFPVIVHIVVGYDFLVKLKEVDPV